MTEDLMVDDLEEFDSKEEPKLIEIQKQLISKCKDLGIESGIGEYSDGDTYVYVNRKTTGSRLEY